MSIQVPGEEFDNPDPLQIESPVPLGNCEKHKFEERIYLYEENICDRYSAFVARDFMVQRVKHVFEQYPVLSDNCTQDRAHWTRLIVSKAHDLELVKVLGLFEHAFETCLVLGCNCQPFRNFREHALTANPPCNCTIIYNWLSHIHIDTCTNTRCPVPGAKVDQIKRRFWRYYTLPYNYLAVEQVVKDKISQTGREANLRERLILADIFPIRIDPTSQLSVPSAGTSNSSTQSR